MTSLVRGGTNSLFGSSFGPATSVRSSRKEIGWNNYIQHEGLSFRLASTPREDVMVATAPLTKHDLITYFASGCKPKEKWRIGTEHEKIGFEFGTLRPIQIEQISDLLNGIAERFDWEKVKEGAFTVGLRQGMKTVTLEGGGQLELSGAPVETLHETCEEIKSHLYQVKSVSEELRIGFLGIGSQPKLGLKDIPHMPKRRCEILTSNYSKTVVQTTTSVQVNLDFSSESDMIKKYRVSLALQPIVTAMFANSPFGEGKPNGYLSFRSHAYTESDPRRTGMIPFVFDDSFGFERYVEYVLDVPLFMLYRNNKYIECGSRASFRDFMKGKLQCLPGEFPTINDWENHLSTIWPEVRLKKYLEMRGADTGTFWNLCAVPALWVGLLYDEVALQNVVDLTADWSTAERDALRNTVPKSGLKTNFRGETVNDVAKHILKLAKDGLERRGYGESRFLDPLIEVVSAGVTPAEKLLELYHGKWSNSVDPVFDKLLY